MSNQTKEMYVRSLVFEAITQLLPTLGRDFTVAINFSDDNHIGIDIKDLTRMGKVVKEELIQNLHATLTQLMSDANKTR